MELTGKEDINVPIEYAFQMLTDVDLHERSILRRGADVKRLDSLPALGVGAKWDIIFQLRGKERIAHLEMTEFDNPNGLTMQAKVKGLHSDAVVDLVALSRTKTRIQFRCAISAKTLPARLTLQSLKLARGKLTKRMNSRLTQLRKDFEARYAQSA